MTIVTTPGGAKLAYLQAGDALLNNDIFDLSHPNGDDFRHEVVGDDSKYYRVGHVLSVAEAKFNFRRYIPSQS